jgi:hypothetical protein
VNDFAAENEQSRITAVSSPPMLKALEKRREKGCHKTRLN